MKKIYFAVPCMNNGGAERVLFLLANGLKKDYEIIFIFMNSNISKFDLSDFNIIEIMKLTLIKKIFFLSKLMKKEKDSVFISFFDEIGMILAVAKGFKKNKLIMSIRNDPKTFPRRKLIFVRNILFRNATYTIFQTKDAQNYFSKKIRKNSEIILNPVKFSDSINFVSKDNREKRFVAFSRINKQKNIPLMIRAFSLFSIKYPEYHLDIYGSKDDDYDNVLSLIKSTKNTKIIMHDFDPELKYKLNNYSAFISSSNFEGISNSMLEALSAGLPSICTDCPIGGTKMFIKEGINGYMTSINNPQEMAEAMEKLILNDNIYKTTFDEINELKKCVNEEVIVNKWKTTISIL